MLYIMRALTSVVYLHVVHKRKNKQVCIVLAQDAKKKKKSIKYIFRIIYIVNKISPHFEVAIIIIFRFTDF